MTVDVEDYFQVSAFEQRIAKEDWDRIPGRVEASTDRTLALFDAHGARATFFFLGWVAERYPDLVRRVAEAGHEVASHGYAHVRASRQSREEFREDVSSAKKLLEDISGTEVRGFRAASFSIGDDNLWTLDLLREAGYAYSSSIYPIAHDHYGMPEAPRHPFRHGPESVLEIPLTTLPLAGRNIPCAGGGYFRLLPYRFSRWALGRVNAREGQPAVFYFHPWELDPEQPRQDGLAFKTRFRHYWNLRGMAARVERLLDDFRWGRVDEVFLTEQDTDHASSLRKTAIA